MTGLSDSAIKRITSTMKGKLMTGLSDSAIKRIASIMKGKLMTGLSDSAIKRIASIMKGKIAMDISELTFWDVESSNVESFAYDEEENILYVRFLARGNNPSTLYAYYNVEPDIFDQFFEADSKGKFIWSHLRDRYEYARIE